MGQIGSLVVAVICAAIYFAPSITAYQRRHSNAQAVLVLNLFLGWTFIGWVVAAVWSCSDNVKPLPPGPAPAPKLPTPRASNVYPDFPDKKSQS